MNIEAIRQHPAAQESLGKGEFHQAILDVGYSKWQEQTRWDYRAMLEHTEKTYGVAAKLFILLGKYNQQVNNGGHSQYYANGYGDGAGGFGDDHDADNPLHQEMIALFKKLRLQSLPSGAKLLAILEEFKVETDEEREIQESCDACGGSGEDGEHGKCPDCGGAGENTVGNPYFGGIENSSELHALDHRYYEISDPWMEELENHIKRWFESGKDSLRVPMLPVRSQLQMRRPFSTPLTYKTMRILLIEDNPGLRKIYLLALDDYEVTSATTAAEAKFMLGRQQFDIVLSDFNLTDGTSAKVFEQFPCPAPHVLLMTGASDDPQFRQMISRFGFPFLAKPFPPSVLRQRIEEMAVQPNLA